MRLGELLLEAKEDAMFQFQTRTRSTCNKFCSWRRNAIVVVSISDEKPLHMRHRTIAVWRQQSGQFQSQTRSRSTCDLRRTSEADQDGDGFQSQTRSRSTCDTIQRQYCGTPLNVSISDEKPLHMRHGLGRVARANRTSFNLRREAAPHATSLDPVGHVLLGIVSISD